MSWLSNAFNPPNTAAAAATQAAAEQKKVENKRQEKIRTGQANIDTAFSQFDPQYYDKFKQTYSDAYLPQIQEQYGVAKDKLTAVLAGRGMLESTPGAVKFGQAERTRADAAANVGNMGIDAANQMKQKIDASKTNLYNLNASAGDPSMAAAQATGAAASFAAPPTLSPLGSVFASTLNGLGTYNKADANSMSPQLPWNTGGYYAGAPLSGRGSSLNG